MKTIFFETIAALGFCAVLYAVIVFGCALDNSCAAINGML